MNSPLGAALIGLGSVFLAGFFVIAGYNLSLLLFLAIAGITFLFFCFIRPKIAYFISLAIPFVFFISERRFNVDLPLGVLIQALIFTVLAFILFKKAVNKDFSFSFINYPTTYAMFAVFIYNIIQVLNPNVYGIEGWLIIMRGNLGIIATYFVVLYLMQDIKFVRQFFIVWLSLAFISGLYACYQDWFGMPAFEINWIKADNLRFRRIFVQGAFRKFSLLSDPAAFGIFMSSSSLVSIILLFSKTKLRNKILLGIGAVVMILGMGYSGTRTSYAMLPAGLCIFGLMTITNKRTLFLIVIGILGFLFILFGPIYGNATINRFRTTFNADDPSLEVRDVNRAHIQKYIHANPMGGGLMTTGDSGLKYNPRHPLAGFPPDSGYLQRALELGWIGLLIFLTLLFVGIRTGIRNYYQCENSEIKYYYLALLVFTFSITIAIYAQLATTQVPISLIFYPVLGMMARMKYVEETVKNTTD